MAAIVTGTRLRAKFRLHYLSFSATKTQLLLYGEIIAVFWDPYEKYKYAL